MSDPRITHRPDTSGGMWGWIAGFAIVVLIAIVLIAGWNGDQQTASNQPNSPAATTGSAPVQDKMAPSARDKMMPPSTTGATPTKPANPATPSQNKQ